MFVAGSPCPLFLQHKSKVVKVAATEEELQQRHTVAQGSGVAATQQARNVARMLKRGIQSFSLPPHSLESGSSVAHRISSILAPNIIDRRSATLATLQAAVQSLHTTALQSAAEPEAGSEAAGSEAGGDSGDKTEETPGDPFQPPYVQPPEG